MLFSMYVLEMFVLVGVYVVLLLCSLGMFYYGVYRPFCYALRLVWSLFYYATLLFGLYCMFSMVWPYLLNGRQAVQAVNRSGSAGTNTDDDGQPLFLYTLLNRVDFEAILRTAKMLIRGIARIVVAITE